MRIIVYGAGAVGSVIGGRLAQAGADVVLVGRPAHVDAIKQRGLTIHTGEGSDTINVSAVTELDDLTPSANDAILLTAKTQDTATMHGAIARWNPHAGVVCGTNGVEHERTALRRFPRTYGMVIQLPASFQHPGEVTAFCLPTNALIDVGCYPIGVDDTARELAAVVNSAPHLLCEADDNIMAKKYDKILVNLGNAAEAAIGVKGRFTPPVRAAQVEARHVYDVANVPSFDRIASAEAAAAYKARRDTMQFVIREGHAFLGGSTWQSLAKGSNTLETDYFNGEIVLLGRMHNTPTPHNEFLQRLATQLLIDKSEPGSMSEEAMLAQWTAATGATV